MIYKDIGKFEGQFFNGVREGFGRMFFSSGEYFFGIWKEDEFSGKGFYCYNDFTLYKGYFQNGKKNG